MLIHVIDWLWLFWRPDNIPDNLKISNLLSFQIFGCFLMCPNRLHHLCGFCFTVFMVFKYLFISRKHKNIWLHSITNINILDNIATRTKSLWYNIKLSHCHVLILWSSSKMVTVFNHDKIALILGIKQFGFVKYVRVFYDYLFN